MRERGSAAPYILGAITVILLAVFVALAVLRGPGYGDERPAPTPQSASYEFGGVAFRYPADWTVTPSIYSTAAGVSDQVGAVFAPELPLVPEDKIGIGGRQTTCESFSSNKVKCKTVFDMPVYTASENAEVLSVFERMAATASSTQPEWTAYEDEAEGFSVEFKRGMRPEKGYEYPLAFGSGKMGTRFAFPTSSWKGSTMSEASVNVLVSTTSCALSADGSKPEATSTPETVNGTKYLVRKTAGAGAGNFYQTAEYATTKGKLCYRVALFMHYTNPGNWYTERADIDAAEARNRQVMSDMESAFGRMVASFSLETR